MRDKTRGLCELARVHRSVFDSNVRLLFQYHLSFHGTSPPLRHISNCDVKTLGVVSVDPYVRFSFELTQYFSGVE
jgi:hypothetical protein